jgi:hypothetical protein
LNQFVNEWLGDLPETGGMASVSEAGDSLIPTEAVKVIRIAGIRIAPRRLAAGVCC